MTQWDEKWPHLVVSRRFCSLGFPRTAVKEAKCWDSCWRILITYGQFITSPCLPLTHQRVTEQISINSLGYTWTTSHTAALGIARQSSSMPSISILHSLAGKQLDSMCICSYYYGKWTFDWVDAPLSKPLGFSWAGIVLWFSSSGCFAIGVSFPVMTRERCNSVLVVIRTLYCTAGRMVIEQPAKVGIKSLWV